ncbi:uncharacterized protein N7473_004149 [Penicillium subrubescens]|uniref:uncharacterized protein n=1 Tax=Penicillium subrubescens TaxID=1316194 RepID=UPI0025454877|nr:uncharacterized protein N7473_004149 [Penicillium subrubescens]KAJ5907233.1 hypothetical protein N7473_004149 [Penicillium subrubescens]
MSESSPKAAKADKSMSSRLLTMKFMQRAAASAATKEPQSPDAEDGKRTPKRVRLSTEPNSPSTPQSDLEAIAAALAAEEDKRREAVARQAAEAGESEWVLDVPATNYTPQPIVLTADSLDAEGDVPQGGRRAYGNFMRKKPVVPVVETKPGEKNTDGGDFDEEEEEQKIPAHIAADPERVKAWMAEAREKALARDAYRKAQRDKIERKRLNNITSISGGGQAGSPRMGAPSHSLKKKKRKF